MYHRDLPESLSSKQTGFVMPLPQLIYRSVFFRSLILIALCATSSTSAYAGRVELTFNPHSLSFGKVITGQTGTLPVTMVNSGSSSVTITQVTVSNSVFSVGNFTVPQTLAAGQSVQFSVSFTPSAVGGVNGTAAFTTNQGTVKLSLAGKGVTDWQLTASPVSLFFGNVAIGNPVALPLTIKNPSATTQSVTIGKVSGTGFAVTGVTLPLNLGPGQSFTFSVVFTPPSAGAFSGTILATSPSTPSLTIPVSGNGIVTGQLTASPGTINFGNVTVGQTSNQTGQLLASGTAITVTAANISNTAFSISGISFPLTLQPGQSANYTVTAAPTSAGIITGNISFLSNAANSPTIQIVSMTAILPQFSVHLSWDPSQSQVVGYNVYRSNQSGGPYSRLNTGLDPDTSYVDSSVTSGQTYYYATTAVDSQGEESAYSNITQAIIP